MNDRQGRDLEQGLRPEDAEADGRLGDRMTLEYRRSFGQEEALRHGLSVEQVYSEVIAPAMEWIGELWQHDEASVADEFLDALERLDVAASQQPSR